MKTKIINKRGELVDHDDSEIIPDGYGVRVPMTLQDSEEEAIASIMDAFGRAAGYRPGYVFGGSHHGEAQARAAHAAMVARSANAWRTIKDNANVETLDSDAAREEYKKRIQNAWKTGQAVSSTEPARPVHNARPAYEAWGGAWSPDELRRTNPKPADRSLSDAAWNELVQRTENAWRAHA